MTILMNRRMWGLLTALERSPVRLESGVRSLLESAVVEHEGCLVFAELLRLSGDRLRAAARDDVDFEASVNDVDLGGELDPEDPAELVALAVETLEVLRSNVVASGFSGVRIIVGVYSVTEFPGATIRFHRLRRDVLPWVDTTTLEEFLSDGILVEDI